MKKAAKWRGNLEDSLGYERFEWKKRILSMVQFLTGEEKTVMDLGAGHMHLKGLLGKDVEYIPVDYRKTSPQTIVCDLNNYQFPDKHVDAIVAAGILGYIDDPLWFLNKICDSTKKCIISYKGKEKYPESMLYTSEIIDYMKSKGFSLTGIDETLDEWTLIGCFEKITPVNLGKQNDCSGCGACINSCPTIALHFEYDDNGFYKPVCESDKCIACMRCTKSCPLINENKKVNDKSNMHVYAAWASENVRLNSSSGGVFSVLATEIIRRGGYVFGACWDEEFNCIIKYTNNINELPAFMHSKYVQSDTNQAFRKVKELVNNRRLVLYVGTPCQIEGLYSYLGENNYNQYLYTIDLICFGVPSNQVFHKYLEENYGIKNIKDIVFRDKKAGEGWSPTGYGIYLKSGEIIHENGNDYYQKAFHSVLFRNSLCEKCEHYKLPRKGDFTLGDFWGIQIHDPTWNDGKGTSVVTVNTRKALDLWSNIISSFERVEEVPIEWCKDKGNRIVTNARSGHPNREYFADLIRSERFNDAVDIAISNKHDVGIVCMMNYNIGNNLTNYALYKVISDMGYRPLMIDMPRDVEESQFYNERGALFYFLRSPYKKYEVYKPKDFWNLYENGDNCEMYIIASDQLWRDKFVLSTKFFTVLNWVPSYKYKISYGTSMGNEDFCVDKKNIAKMKQLIGRINKISVREESAKRILNNWGEVADVVLDPVFICQRKHFDELANRGRLRTLNKPYVAGYFLDPTREKESFLEKMAHEKYEDGYMIMTEPVYTEMPNSALNYTLEPGIEEWVAMIKDSEYVITDSFHGMCFAIIYEKQFFVLFDSSNWRGRERFRSFLSMIGMNERLILDSYDIEQIKDIPEIDYKSLNRKIDELKEHSLEWLKNAMEESKDFVGSIDYYDYYLNIEKNKIEAKEELKKIKSDCFFQKQLLRNIKINRKDELNTMVVGWGAGWCFRKNIQQIQAYSGMKFVCDNNPALWGTKLTDNIICISPAELLKIQNPMVLIMVEDAASAISITNELLEMGITHYDHINNWLKELR